MFKDKKLLVLSHTYNSFIKDPVEILAKDFKKIYVLVRYSPIAELSKIIPLSIFKNREKFSKKYSIDLKNKPNNVEVILVPLWYLPFDFFYKSLGKKHAKKVFKIIKKKNIKFDLIHSHFTWSAGYVGMKIKEKYQKPLILTGHGYDIYELPFRNQSWRKRIKEVLNSADEIITVSKKNESCIKEIGVKKEINILPNGYNENLFFKMNKLEARKNLNLPQNKKIILTIGNLEKVKGYNILLKSLKLVLEKRKDFICLHIGTGSEESFLTNLKKNLKLENHIEFLGMKKHNELVSYFGACDIFVSSSLSEGNPTVMFETLGCGKPFIGTKVGGIPDVIISEDYGLLCEPNRPQELANNILLGLEKEWDSLKILKYSKKYTWKNICKELIKIYEKQLC